MSFKYKVINILIYLITVITLFWQIHSLPDNLELSESKNLLRGGIALAFISSLVGTLFISNFPFLFILIVIGHIINSSIIVYNIIKQDPDYETWKKAIQYSLLLIPTIFISFCEYY